MSNKILQHGQKGVVRITLLALAIFMAMPGQLLAQAKSCNPYLDFNILNEPPYFVGEPMTVSANIGAKDILGGTYQDIKTFGFATDCKEGEGFHTCSGTDAEVEFLENFTTNCTDGNGDPAQLLVPEFFVPIQVKGTEIRTAANTQCNVQFDMAVTGLDPLNNTIVQAMGWPVEGEAPTTCDNSLTSTTSSTISYEVESCGIEVIKEVWDPLTEDWVDANTDESAPRIGLDDTVAYRLKVKNTSTVDFIGDLHVVDLSLGVDGMVTPAFDVNGEMIIGGGDESIFDLEEVCDDLIEGGVGIFTNTASVEGTCRGPEHSGGAITALASDIAKIDCRKKYVRKSGIALQKFTNGQDADTPTGPYVPVGGPVNWTYTVYNTGDEGINLTSLSDPKVPELGLDDCDKTFIPDEEFATCTASGIAIPEQYRNDATVKGVSDYTGTPLQDSDPSHYFGMLSSIDLVKTPDPLMYSYVGEVITYTFKVTNTSNVVLTNVHVTDPLTGLSVISCPKSELVPAESMDCTATYSITQSDLNATFVDNTATAHGTDPLGGEVTDQDSATINTEPVYSLALVKVAAPLTYSAAGQVITYGYTLTNSGNQTLYPPYSVADNKTTVTCADQPASLAPAASIVCAATYTILDGDLPPNTSVTNVAQGKAYDAAAEGNEVLSNNDEETVYYIGLTVRKEIFDDGGWLDANTADTAPVKHYPAGALYRVVVANVGAVDLDNVVISDAEIGLNNAPVNGGQLAVGEEVTITEGEVGTLNWTDVCTEFGDVMNTVNASGTAVTSGAGVSDSDVAWVSCVGTPEILVKKYISIDGGANYVDGTAGPVQAPSGALYKITVKNVGETDLIDVFVDDPMIPNGPALVGNLAKTEEYTITDGVIDTSGAGSWADLDVSQVCGNSGLFENEVTATGTSAEYDEDTTDTDDAFLNCIGAPMISILKKVKFEGDAEYVDADNAPYPTAVVDTVEDTALYQITVKNIGAVELFNVLVNDATLGIVDYLIGSLIPGEEAVIDSGDIAALSVSNICSSTGEKSNVAYAKGTSAAGVTDEMSDSATVDCIGEPAIRILKEVSANGTVWDAAEITTLAPSDAYYRITVSNIGNVALENVTVSDSILGISNYVPTGTGGSGKLAIGETVVISHTGGGDNELTDLHVLGICDGAEIIENTATANGKSVESTETVNAEDDATLICEVPVDICAESGRPQILKMQYEGVSIIDHHQGASGIIVPEVVALPSDAMLELYDKSTLEETVLKGIGEPFNILGAWTSSGKIPPNITIKIFDYEMVEGVAVKGSLYQTVTFHGSCSAPLIVGDQFGGVSIIDYTPF